VPEYVAVLPSIQQEWTNRCLRTCKIDVCVVDNIPSNRGVAASWNQGVQWMRDEGKDWLIIMSATCRFGESGGQDLLDALDVHPTAMAVEAWFLGWHLIAFHRRVFDLVGTFDENFYPAYFEDNDFGYRITRALGTDLGPWWPKPFLDVSDAGPAHGVRFAGVQSPAQPLIDYYTRKWGGPPGHETFDRPFGNNSNELSYWEPRR